jgi:Zn-dependent M28 family amino/carboxypeptidase
VVEARPIVRALRRVLLVSSLAVTACGPEPIPSAPVHFPPPPVGSSPRREPSIPLEPDAAARIAADVTYLASPELAGRGTGEPGAKLAADFVAKRFESLGLRPMGDRDAAGAPGWFQKFSARVGAKVEPAAIARVAPKGAKDVPAPEGGAVTADGSASGKARGDAVFVGYGISANAVGWDDYAASKLDGKIAVVLAGVPTLGDQRGRALRDFGASRYKIRTAREHGAAGVVIFAEGDDLPPIPNDPTSMGVPAVVVKASAAKALLASTKFDPARARAATDPVAPAPIDKVVLSLETRIEPTHADAVNVVGILPARDASPTASEWVVVGAHFDHLGHGGTSASRAPGVHAVHPGADDNASGTAMLLDVARRISKLPQRPPRTVVFVAFGAEEIGVLGSRHFVEHPPLPLGSLSAMINADMVGRLRGRRLLVDGIGTSAGWADLVRDANEGLGLVLTFGNEGFGASDHASFTAARVPVTFLFTGVHDDYHKPTDTSDRVDAAGIERIATLATRLAVGVAERRERLAFVDAPADPHRRGMRGGFRVSLGTMPDYAFQGKGMRLSGVRADAPAALAGLKAGDVILKVGAHDVGNVHDFMYALGELEPGRAVKVEIDRDGARTSVEVIPAPGR